MSNLYRGFTIQTKDEMLIPLPDLSHEWGVDYKTLRKFCRDHPHLGTRKLTIRNPDREDESSVIIVITEEALPTLYRLWINKDTNG